MTMTASKTYSDTSALLDGMPLDNLHGALRQAEQQITQLDSSNIEQFLVQMDKIAQLLTSHLDHGSNNHGSNNQDSRLQASPSREEERWQSLLQFITTNPQLVTRAAA